MRESPEYIFIPKTAMGIYGDSRFLCYQNPFSDECEIKLTEDCKFEELFDGGEYESTGKVLKYGAPKGDDEDVFKKIEIKRGL